MNFPPKVVSQNAFHLYLFSTFFCWRKIFQLHNFIICLLYGFEKTCGVVRWKIWFGWKFWCWAILGQSFPSFPGFLRLLFWLFIEFFVKESYRIRALRYKDLTQSSIRTNPLMVLVFHLNFLFNCTLKPNFKAPKHMQRKNIVKSIFCLFRTYAAEETLIV